MHSTDVLHGQLVAALRPMVGVEIVAGPRAMQRGYADAIEGHIGDAARTALSALPGVAADPARSRRSLEDFSASKDGAILRVDIKSRDTAGTFSMPNLVSIQRLWKILEDRREALTFVFADYTVVDPKAGTARIDSLCAIKAASINADAVQIQNLGRGQLQLRSTATSSDLAAPCSAGTLQARLPEMAAAFHRRQMAKAARDLELWIARGNAAETAAHP